MSNIANPFYHASAVPATSPEAVRDIVVNGAEQIGLDVERSNTIKITAYLLYTTSSTISKTLLNAVAVAFPNARTYTDVRNAATRTLARTDLKLRQDAKDGKKLYEELIIKKQGSLATTIPSFALVCQAILVDAMQIFAITQDQLKADLSNSSHGALAKSSARDFVAAALGVRLNIEPSKVTTVVKTKMLTNNGLERMVAGTYNTDAIPSGSFGNMEHAKKGETSQWDTLLKACIKTYRKEHPSCPEDMVNALLQRPTAGELEEVTSHRKELYVLVKSEFVKANYPDMMHLWANLWRAYDLYNSSGYMAKLDKVDVFWIEKIVKAHGLTHAAYVRIQHKIQQPYHKVLNYVYVRGRDELLKAAKKLDANATAPKRK